VPRLRRVDCSGPGIARRRRGRGFEYLDEEGRRIEDPEVLARIRELAIPPAWNDVWICRQPMGHLQATGVDAAGRKQYRYHDEWRRRRDQQKFDSMLEFARALPAMRRRLSRDVRGDEPTRRRVLACAVRLLDLGLFRIGSEGYADQNQTYGLATMLKRHVRLEEDEVVFDYEAKGGKRQVHAIAAADVRDLIQRLKRRRGSGEELLAYREGGRWHDVRSDDINEYVKEVSAGDFTAKDFRTWNATVLAAVALATDANAGTTKTARKRAITAAVKHVAAYLGNTPAVSRASYIDPRVFDRYRSGWTIRGVLDEIGGEPELADPRKRARIEAAVLDLLEDRRTDALERNAA
jgi:DNA topoisomerase I